MTAIVLHQPQGVAAVTRPKPPLEIFFRCTNGILLRVPMDAFLGRRGVAPSERGETRKLLREVVALKQAKKK